MKPNKINKTQANVMTTLAEVRTGNNKMFTILLGVGVISLFLLAL